MKIPIMPRRTFIGNTGRWRFRTNFLGKLILQVEYRIAADSPGEFNLYWRDAKTTDISWGDLLLVNKEKG